MFNPPMDLLLVSSILLSLLGMIRKKKDMLAGLLTLFVLTVSFLLVFQWFTSYERPLVIFPSIFSQISSYFRIDLFSVFLSFLSLSIAFLITIFNFRYPSKKKISYYILLLICQFGILGIAFSYDLFVLLVFWEIMAISSYFLITFGPDTDELVALKYIFISVVGSAILMFSLALIFSQVFSLNFQVVKTFIDSNPTSLVKFLFVLSIICFAIKAGVVPFHTWLPDTYQEAYSPTSAWLSAILSKVGLFALLRIMFLFFSVQVFIQITLMIIAFLTMFTGNILALFEKDLKRILAFSSMAHVGYILFAFSMFTASSVAAGMLHMITHAISKTLMFFIAGVCLYISGRKRIKEIVGIGRMYPILGLGIMVGMMTLIGMPPFAVFISELLIVLAGIKSGYFALVALFLLNVFVSLVFYIRILRELVIKKPKKKFMKTIPLTMQFAMFLLIFGSVFFGVYPDVLIEFVRSVAYEIFLRV